MENRQSGLPLLWEQIIGPGEGGLPHFYGLMPNLEALGREMMGLRFSEKHIDLVVGRLSLARNAAKRARFIGTHKVWGPAQLVEWNGQAESPEEIDRRHGQMVFSLEAEPLKGWWYADDDEEEHEEGGEEAARLDAITKHCIFHSNGECKQ